MTSPPITNPYVGPRAFERRHRQLFFGRSQEIMDLLLNLNKERGTTLVIVTHDPKVAAQANRTINIIDGVVEGSIQ